MCLFQVIQIQSKSLACAQYCLIYLLLRARGFSFVQNALYHIGEIMK